MEGLSLRPKGAAALLHRRGESPLRLVQGAVWRVGRRAPITTEGSQRLCCAGSGSPVRHRARSATRNDRRRRHTATEGSRGSAAPEGEPRPTLNRQRDATDGGTLTASEGSLRLCCTGGESPPCGLMQGAVWRIGWRAPMQPKGASGSAAPGVGAPSATEHAAQLGMTDGGVTLRPKGAVGLLHRKGSPVRRWMSKETRLMEGLSLRPKGACGSAAPEGRVPLCGWIWGVFFFFFFK